jgi:hypothetical protein
MAFRIPRNHPITVIRSIAAQRGILVLFGTGFLMGYVSFIVGVVGALHGIRSLIQIMRHRRRWLSLLKQHDAQANDPSSAIPAMVIQKRRMRDPITGSILYKVLLNYQMKSEEEENRFLTLTTDDAPYAARSVYYDSPDEGKYTKIYLVRGKAIPTDYYQDKISDLQVWAKFVDPCIVFIGLYAYFFLAWLYVQIASTSTQSFIILSVLSILSPLLMTPYLILETRIRHQNRLEALCNNPIQVISDFDRLRNIWHSLGPTLVHKLYPILFAVGLLGMAVFSNIGILPGCWSVYTLTQWTDMMISRQREILVESLRLSKKVTGQLIDCHIPGIGQPNTYSVIFRYTAPTGEIVEKNMENERLYFEFLKRNERSDDETITGILKPVSVDVLVSPNTPTSGYPEMEISETWRTCKTQTVSILSMTLYVMWYLIQYDDWLPIYFPIENDLLDYLVNDILVFWIPGLASICFMMPQAYIFHRSRYRKLLADIFEEGKVIERLNM